MEPLELIPLADVVIPVYNAASTIESAVASIQKQTERNIRIIIVNDGSTDATRNVIQKLAAEDGRITLIDQDNGGIVDALNRGLAAVTASFIARHDADDIASPDRLAKQLAYLSANPVCTAVSGAIRHIDEAGDPLGDAYQLPSPDLANVEHYPQLEPYLSHPFLMMRRAAVEKVGNYRYVFHAEDTDLYWRLQEVGKLHNLPDYLGDYRVHSQSITGASLLNGRVSAVNSQRAGFSAIRRRSGRPDLSFPKTLLAEYKAAGSLEGIIRVGSLDLETDEAKRLAVSTCAKLLELGGHRPYELEFEDCTTIHQTLLPALPRMTAESRRYCQRMLSGTAARLASSGAISAARLLTPLQLYPAVAAKLVLRSGVPLSLRRILRQAIRRDGFVK